MKLIRVASKTKVTNANDLAIMDAGAIAHHGKEDGGGNEEEAERVQHDPVQGVGENLKKSCLENKNNAIVLIL